MDLQLTNKVALLAAATDGLGLATAQQLLKEGAKVAICGRDENRNLSAKKTLLQMSDENHVLVYSCDVTNAEQVNAFVKITIDKFKQLDMLITNAGGTACRNF